MSDAIGAAWSDVRNDKSDTHWVVCKANDDLKGLSLTASGTSGFDDFMKAFEGAETVMYGGMRIRAVDNRGTVKSVRSKFIKVALIPDNIPAVKRARATQLKPIADELLGGTHASFDIATSADLTRKVVEKQLQATCGAHQPSHYDFDGINGEDAHTNANKGIAVAAPPPAPEEPKSPEKPPEPSPKREAPAAPAVEVPASIADAWALVQGNSSPINWVALTYDGKSAASAKVLGMGDDGLAGFKEILEDDLVIFGGLRVTAIDDRGTVKSIRAKYVFVQFVGTGVKPLTRANAGPMKSHFEAILSGCHLTVATSNVADLTAEMIEQRLQSNCGAHRPNGYDFGKKIVDMASF